jgi:uncharacterized membrane protein
MPQSGNSPRQQDRRISSAAIANIDAIAQMEEEFLSSRTLWERFADAIAAFTGSVAFVVLHLAGFAGWFAVNLGAVPGIRPFDPYPFILLAMAVSCEGVLLSTFVLMKQNRMSRRAEQRDHLHLQVALLAEKELTKLLQGQQRMSGHLGIPEVVQDPETRELSEDTAVDSIARELRRKLPDEAT